MKCDFCVDRFNSGFYTGYRDGKPTTACELTCPPGAIVTGPVVDVRDAALSRLAVVKANNRKANLHQGKYGRTQVIFLLTETPAAYGIPLK
jgi:Fe-S-cluster-containing dehydrogenase component